MSEINDVYKKVDKLFKIKLAAQIKGSGLEFNKFTIIQDLVNETQYFILYIDNKKISFINLGEFYSELRKLVEEKLVENKIQLDYIEDQINEDLAESYWFDSSIESLYHEEYKLNKIIGRIDKLTILNLK
jgi:hypothetical protein